MTQSPKATDQPLSEPFNGEPEPNTVIPETNPEALSGDEYGELRDPMDIRIHGFGSEIKPDVLGGFYLKERQRGLADSFFAQADLRAARKFLSVAGDKPGEIGASAAGFYSTMPTELAVALQVDPRDSVAVARAAAIATDEVMDAFLHWNNEHMMGITRELEPRIDEEIERFKGCVQEAITKRNLPLSLEQLETRMSDFAVTVMDPILAIGRHDGTLLGRYNASDRAIYINPTESGEHFSGVAVHEMLHHLSGQTVRVDTDLVTVERVGLATLDGLSAQWCGEAITEQLTQALMAGKVWDFRTVTPNGFFAKRSGVYQSERYVLSQLMKDLSVYDMLAAYFEDARPEQAGHLELHAKFWASVDDEFGKGTARYVADAAEFSTGDDAREFILALRHAEFRRHLGDKALNLNDDAVVGALLDLL